MADRAATRRIPYMTTRSFDLLEVVGEQDQPISQQCGLATPSARHQRLGASILIKGTWYLGRLV